MVKRLREKDRLPIIIDQNNTTVDTRMYKVEYKDGHKAALPDNKISGNMVSQVDGEGNRHVLF